MKKELVLAVLFSLVLLSPVRAQGTADFWSIIYSLGFIIIFVLILLAVGGVIHWPTGGGKWGLIFVFAVLLIAVPYILYNYLSSSFPTYTEVPPSFKKVPLPSYVSTVLQMLGLPSEWMWMPAIIYLFILPFAGIYTIVWAFLQALGIFDRKVNRVLALLVTFLTIPIGWFVRLTWLLFAGMGIWSVVVFVVMFILGIFFRGAQVVGKEYVELSKLVDIRRARLKDLQKELEALKGADLQTIKDVAPQLIQRFADVMNVNTQALLSTAAQAPKLETARAAIEQAEKEVEKSRG